MKKRKPKIEISLEEIIAHSQITGTYAPILNEVLKRKITVEEAKKSGITVTTGQLQKAADVFRHSYNLSKARDFRNWLATTGASLEVFEKHLEENMYISKFKDLLEKRTNKGRCHPGLEARAMVGNRIYREWLGRKLS